MVNAVNAFRRRCGEPTHSPMAGASSATVTPAMAIARPSQLAGEVPPGPPTATFVVRYTLKTKVTTIAFSPAEPQSHSAHTSTRDLLTVAFDELRDLCTAAGDQRCCPGQQRHRSEASRARCEPSTDSNCRACPKVNSPNSVPIVEGAHTVKQGLHPASAHHINIIDIVGTHCRHPHTCRDKGGQLSTLVPGGPHLASSAERAPPAVGIRQAHE